MSTERTLCILKPGVMERRLLGEIISRIERKGFVIRALKMDYPSSDQWKSHYAEHIDRDFYPALLEFMSSGPVTLLVLEGTDSVKHLRHLSGSTDPTQAQPGTIRGDYACLTRKNVIHASDSPANAEREIAIFFAEKEVGKQVDVMSRYVQ